MKAIHLILSAALLASPALAQTAPPPAPAPAPLNAPPAATPQVNIAVGVFKCNAARCTVDLGTGLADALMNALSDTGAFAVYERENVPQLVQNNFIGGSDPAAALSPVDVLVFGNINTYEPDSASGQGCFLGVCVGGKESTIGADLRVVDSKTGRVIATAKVEGKSSSNSAGISFGGISLGGNKSSGVDKAVGMMLAQAVQVLQSKIPANYYR
jgi:curli biogenesis system outer membrane secretion channel CsgG